MAYEIFISYSSKDKTAADAVCAHLERENLHCWIAPRDVPVGKDWAESIISALNTCRVVVLIFSSSANTSPQVTREVQRAFEKGLAVFPFRIENVQPTPGLEYYMGSVHWLDALTEPLEPHIAKLAIQVKAALSGIPAPVAPAELSRPVPTPGANAKRKGRGPILAVAAGAVVVATLAGVALWPRSKEAPSVFQTASTSAPKATLISAVAPEPPPAASPVPEAPKALVRVTAPEPSAATSEVPWLNSLGMEFVPVPETEVLFSVWDTRLQDYDQFIKETERPWSPPNFEQGPLHPVVNVSWEDAKAFCDWLTEKERNAGILPKGLIYRLPTNEEWNRAFGLPKEPGNEDAERKGVYPWGTLLPPPEGSGNYASSLGVDSFAETAPVGSFSPNRFGLYDLGGNVWKWSGDGEGTEFRTARGGAWNVSTPRQMLSSYGIKVAPTYRNAANGFRCVLARLTQ